MANNEQEEKKDEMITMFTTAEKEARRAIIRAELVPLKESYDNNRSARNQLSENIGDLTNAKHRLDECIRNFNESILKVEYSHGEIGKDYFKGTRRNRLEERLHNAASGLKQQAQRHQNNFEALTRAINERNTSLNQLEATLRNQDSRITQLEAELRTLW